MVFLIAVLTFLTIFIVVYILLKTYAPVEGPAEMRLRALDAIMDGRSDIDDELATPFSQTSAFTADRFACCQNRAIDAKGHSYHGG